MTKNETTGQNLTSKYSNYYPYQCTSSNQFFYDTCNTTYRYIVINTCICMQIIYFNRQVMKSKCRTYDTYLFIIEIQSFNKYFAAIIFIQQILWLNFKRTSHYHKHIFTVNIHACFIIIFSHYIKSEKSSIVLAMQGLNRRQLSSFFIISGPITCYNKCFARIYGVLSHSKVGKRVDKSLFCEHKRVFSAIISQQVLQTVSLQVMLFKVMYSTEIVWYREGMHESGCIIFWL